MKKFIEFKTGSIHPIMTSKGWILVMMPLSVEECFTYFLDDVNIERGDFLHTTIYLN